MGTYTPGNYEKYILYRLSRAWNARFKPRAVVRKLDGMLLAIGVIAVALVADYLLVKVIGIRFDAQAVMSKALLTVCFAASVFAAFAAAGFVSDATGSYRQLRERSVNAHLVRVSTRIAGVVVALFIVIHATEYLGFPLAPVSAGLGIGGLAKDPLCTSQEIRTIESNTCTGIDQLPARRLPTSVHCRASCRPLRAGWGIDV